MKKRIISILLFLTMAMSFSMAVSATEIQPFWSDTNTYEMSLTFSGTNASCVVLITGATGTTKIDSCNVTLKSSNGSTIQSWSNQSATGSELNFSKSASSVSKGNTYTLSFSANVHRNGTIQPISGSITKTY